MATFLYFDTSILTLSTVTRLWHNLRAWIWQLRQTQRRFVSHVWSVLLLHRVLQLVHVFTVSLRYFKVSFNLTWRPYRSFQRSCSSQWLSGVSWSLPALNKCVCGGFVSKCCHRLPAAHSGPTESHFDRTNRSVPRCVCERLTSPVVPPSGIFCHGSANWASGILFFLSL